MKWGEYMANELEEELQKMFAYTNATHVSPEPVFQGTGAQLAPVLNRLGILPKVEVGKEQPGWLDNLGNAITSDNSVLFEKNNFVSWYEIGRRGSVMTTFGDYFSLFLHGLNTLLNSGDMAREKIGSEINKIKAKYPVSSETPKEYADKERREKLEKATEIEKERIRWTPVELTYEENGRKGKIQVLPGLGYSPWVHYNLGGVAGKEVAETPEEARFGGISSYKTVPSETFDKLFTEYDTLAKKFQNYTIESERIIRDGKIDLAKYEIFLNTIKEKRG